MNEEHKNDASDRLRNAGPKDQSADETAIFKLPDTEVTPEMPVEADGSTPQADASPPPAEDVSIADVELPRRTKKKSKVKAFLKYLALIVFVVGLLGPAQYVLYSNRVQPNIYVADIEIGGLTKAQAVDLLTKEYSSLIEQPVLYVQKGKTKEFDPNDHNLQIFVKKTVDRAYSIGREKDVLDGARTRLELLTKRTVLDPSFDLDQESMNRFLDKIAGDTDRPKREAEIDLSESKPVVVRSLIGFRLDKKALQEDLLAQTFRKQRHKVIVQPRKIIPDVSTPGTEQAFNETKNILRSQIALVDAAAKFRLEIASADMRSFIQFSKERASEPLSKKTRFFLRTGVDDEVATAYMLLKCKALILEPVEAEFVVEGNSVRITESKDGKTIDTVETGELVLEAARTGGSKDVAIVYAKKVPERSTAQAESYGIQEPIGSFTTDFDPAYTQRVNYIKALSNLLNGTIIQPGETFSMNDHMATSGGFRYYQEESFELNGENLATNGGAAAQVATTLFNTAFFSGIKIDERTNVSSYIAKYPPGRDASVSSPKPDLKITNDLENHILIQSTTTPSSVTIRFFSTKTTRKVFLKSSGFSNFVPFITETVMDASLDVGTTVKQEEGVDGRRITVTRTVKDGDKTIHEDSFVSYYVPRNQLIKVGSNSETTTTSTTLTPGQTTTTLSSQSTTTTVPTTTTTLAPTTTTTLPAGGGGLGE